jgi:hypothetical protein
MPAEVVRNGSAHSDRLDTALAAIQCFDSTCRLVRSLRMLTIETWRARLCPTLCVRAGGAI